MSDAGTPEGARAEALERIKASVPVALANAIWLAAKDSESESPRRADAVLVAAIKVWPGVVDEIAAALSRAAQGAHGVDAVLAIFDNFYAPDDPWAQACRKQLVTLGKP